VRAFPALAALGAGLALAGAPLGSPADPSPAAPSAAPIVTLAAGGAPWTPDDLASLKTGLDALIDGAPALRGAHAGVIALDTATGDVLYARAADDEFQPASTLKLLVGSAALEKLGPDFRFHTEAALLASPGGLTPPGGLADDLLVEAGGDPLFSRDDAAAAARAVAATGVRTLGRVLIDDSHFDLRPYAAGWTWDDFAFDYAARASAMTLDENVVHVTVAPAVAPGRPALVRAEPPALVAAPAGGCEASLTNRIAIVPRATTTAAGSDADVDVALGQGGCIDVVGSIALGEPDQTLDAAVYDPLLYAESIFAYELRAAGVAVAPFEPVPGSLDAAIRRPAAPAAASAQPPVWTHDSPPLGTFIGPRFWIPSDNLVGELLLKELGFASGGKPGTTAKGIAFEKIWLRSIGIDPATVTLADGCGMSQYDRITPRDLVTILQHDWNGPNRQTVLDSLPIGAVRGTIEGIAGTAAAGRVFAKTGSMMHVRGLAGYLSTERHGTVTFAFNVDDWNGDYPSLAALRAAVLSRIVTE
jgi:D-alanyl-D-alanine carboxypeptidase/D-alanyl-D-alanine-endopeptidase (penicillin-binding protein 4)